MDSDNSSQAIGWDPWWHQADKNKVELLRILEIFLGIHRSLRGITCVWQPTGKEHFLQGAKKTCFKMTVLIQAVFAFRKLFRFYRLILMQSPVLQDTDSTQPIRRKFQIFPEHIRKKVPIRWWRQSGYFPIHTYFGRGHILPQILVPLCYFNWSERQGKMWCHTEVAGHLLFHEML